MAAEPAPWPGFRLAFNIVCAADRGRCRRTLATAWAPTPGTSRHALYLRSTAGLDAVVGYDFTGATNIVFCDRHPLVTAGSGPGKHARAGLGGPGLDYRDLQGAYERFQATGRPAGPVRWAPPRPPQGVASRRPRTGPPPHRATLT